MEKKVLKDILSLQDKIKKESIVERDIMKKIKEFSSTKLIVILSGIRRSGKSTLLLELKTEQAYYVNFDDERFINFEIKDFQTMYDLLIELFGEKNIFLFDEIQNITGWERFVRRLHNEGKKVYITGSNATMLSRELGTHLTGRNIMLSLFPFSFTEFLRWKKTSISIQTSKEKSMIKKEFNEYMKKGGFPEYLQTEKNDYIQSVYENILYRDIITRYKLTSEKPIKEVVYYVASNVGKELSFNTLRKLTGLTSTTTIREYFEYLENSYLIFLVPRFNFSLKKQIYSNKKPYFIDNAMARNLGFRATKDKGRMLENSVFLALKKMGYEIYYHKEKHECDFLVRVGAKIKTAIQVTKSLEKNNKKRELAGLMEALQTYRLKEGIILTEDQEETIRIQKKKIIVKPIWKWLIENKV